MAWDDRTGQALRFGIALFAALFFYDTLAGVLEIPYLGAVIGSVAGAATLLALPEP